MSMPSFPNIDPRRPSRAGRASGALHGGSRQGALHLRFQEELVLNGGLQHATYALGNALPPFYLMWLKPSCDAGT